MNAASFGLSLEAGFGDPFIRVGGSGGIGHLAQVVGRGVGKGGEGGDAGLGQAFGEDWADAFDLGQIVLTLGG